MVKKIIVFSCFQIAGLRGSMLEIKTNHLKFLKLGRVVSKLGVVYRSLACRIKLGRDFSRSNKLFEVFSGSLKLRRGAKSLGVPNQARA